MPDFHTVANCKPLKIYILATWVININPSVYGNIAPNNHNINMRREAYVEWTFRSGIN